MSGEVVYRPHGEHHCNPGIRHEPLPADGSPPPQFEGQTYVILPGLGEYPAGTVWECECGKTWVSQGMVKPYTPAGHVSASLEWKPERRRARRKRERQGATPEQLWPRCGQAHAPAADSITPPRMASAQPPPPAQVGIIGGGYKPRATNRTEPYTESIDVPGGTVTFPFGITDEQAERVRDVFTGTATATPPKAAKSPPPPGDDTGEPEEVYR